MNLAVPPDQLSSTLRYLLCWLVEDADLYLTLQGSDAFEVFKSKLDSIGTMRVR